MAKRTSVFSLRKCTKTQPFEGLLTMTKKEKTNETYARGDTTLFPLSAEVGCQVLRRMFILLSGSAMSKIESLLQCSIHTLAQFNSRKTSQKAFGSPPRKLNYVHKFEVRRQNTHHQQQPTYKLTNKKRKRKKKNNEAQFPSLDAVPWRLLAFITFPRV